MANSDGGDSNDDMLLKCLHENGIVLPKDYLLQAIDAVSRPQQKPVGRKARIMAAYDNREHATSADGLCADRSHLPGYCSRVTNRSDRKRKHDTSLLPILNEMRLCLLASDWDGYKELLLVLFGSPNVPDEYILYAVQSCFVLLFNHPNRNPELLDVFMASCLKINDESRKIRYLTDCFRLKNESSFPDTVHGQQLQEESEEEEIFFCSDYSSD